MNFLLRTVLRVRLPGPALAVLVPVPVRAGRLRLRLGLRAVSHATVDLQHHDDGEEGVLVLTTDGGGW